MTLENISVGLQELLILDYEFKVKTILMVGWFILSLIYLNHWYKEQKETKLFIVGTFRASMYVTAWLYSWLFWLIYPIYIHPNVPIDNLLLFLGWAYTGLSTVFFVIFAFNFTLWIPKALRNFGKIDVSAFEGSAIRNYFGKGGKSWFKEKK